MTSADIATIKDIVLVLKDMRESGDVIPTRAQAAEIALIGEKPATAAALCMIGIAVLTAESSSAFLGYMCIKLAGWLAESHPQQPTPAETLRLLADVSERVAKEPGVPLTSANTTDKGAN